MRQSFRVLIASLAAFSMIAFAVSAMGAANSNALTSVELYEEQGLEYGAVSKNFTGDDITPVIMEALPDSEDVLLIPNSDDDYVGMYDPETGDFLGIFISGFEQFSTPICAMEGPDDKIYVSDQVADAVFVFDREGMYLETYADDTDGLNNVRGIDFRDGHLFVTSGDDYVAEFDGPHSRLTDFINDGSDPFDIYFFDDGCCLLADIQGSTDNVRMYNADGTMRHQVFGVSFPEQIQTDLSFEGNCINASFSDDMITYFDSTTMYEQIPFDAGRGIFRLGNGNILATNSSGVFELDPETGTIIEQKNTGSSRFIELIPARIPTGIGDNSNLPSTYALNGNYPNPFNATTQIKYQLPEPSEVVIEVYDILGRQVATLEDGYKAAGHHQIIWHADRVSSGIYFYKITAGEFHETAKMTLLK